MRPGSDPVQATEAVASGVEAYGANGTVSSLLMEYSSEFNFMVDFLGRVKGLAGGRLGAHNGFAA